MPHPPPPAAPAPSLAARTACRAPSRRALSLPLLILVLLLGPTPSPAGGGWRAGLARVDITPSRPVWLAGYAARREPPRGAVHPLWAKALALADSRGARVVLVTSDLIGLVRPLSDAVARRVHERLGIERARLVLNSSHTHAGPLVRESATVAYGLEGEHREAVEGYTRELEDKLVALIERAVADLRDAELASGRATADFAMNRRHRTPAGYVIAPDPGGPVDHTVPVLRVTAPGGAIRALVFGYACHNTTLGADFLEYCGDYAGFAQEALEAAHPGTTALFVLGCGGDSNPEPRGSLEIARRHGQALATAVEAALAGELRAVRGPLEVAFGRTPLPFVAPPSRAALLERLDQGNVYHRRLARRLLDVLDTTGALPADYPFPAQVVRFGADLTLVALAGEVVVDYAHRLRREFPVENLWIAAYTNEVFAYVPSERVLAEGGYEGRDAMVYFGWHGPFARGVEEQVVELVRRLVRRCREPESLRFRVHHLATDTSEGCAVADVDRDGLLDVIAGRNWYRAPAFTPRPLRAIGEFGKDYSEMNGEHAWDLNGDGWIDMLSGSFLPTEVRWFENPGAEGLACGKQWPAHVLHDTGETTNEMTWLRDLDGDGTPEYIANSWNPQAAMLVWRLTRNEAGRPALEKVVIGAEGNGHGLGFGDVNGDGLEDILFQDGWYERPGGGALGGGWKLHRDWHLPGASCPMLVVDLDGDGRNDIIWSKGHDYGLYWRQQLPPREDGATAWKEHLIDESFSQAHALLWEDLDGDGRPELITGKRVRAHSGGDPGAGDPAVLYYYRWDPEGLAFRRHTIAAGSAGTGLQIRAADLDGDGRPDLAVAGKSGTYVLFNEGR